MKRRNAYLSWIFVGFAFMWTPLFSTPRDEGAVILRVLWMVGFFLLGLVSVILHLRSRRAGPDENRQDPES